MKSSRAHHKETNTVTQVLNFNHVTKSSHIQIRSNYCDMVQIKVAVVWSKLMDFQGLKCYALLYTIIIINIITVMR